MSKSETPAPSPSSPPPPAAKPVEAATTVRAEMPAQKPPSPRRAVLPIVGIIVALVAVFKGVPLVQYSLKTVSTDDAFVNGHVTLVAARVPGQVKRVLVDDNNAVHAGDPLLELDPEPFQTKADIAQAVVQVAQSDLISAQAQVRGEEGLARSLRYNLQRTIEDVDNQLAVLRSKVAAVKSKKASVAKAKADYDRVAPLVKTGAASKQEYDASTEAVAVANSQLEEAMQGVYQVRAALGLPPQPAKEEDLDQVPEDLDQSFSAVKEAQARLIQVAGQLGVGGSFNRTPKQMLDDFYKRDPTGDIDKIYETVLKEAPEVKRAEAKVAEAQRNLEEAQLNLKYCTVTAEIDGVVTRRNVNPGNNIVAGQSLMAVRSLSEIWVDANFKETQLGRLRIGQRVELDVDMYGSAEKFEGRISGFTMGTGSTLALLPGENATGNFVKVVQRVPVRIEIQNYNPEKTPLIIGASVEPHVFIDEKPSGPNAGQILQPYATTTAKPAGSTP